MKNRKQGHFPYFLTMKPEMQMLYMVGRHTGIFSCLADLDDDELRGHTQKAMAAHRVTLENVDAWAAEMMQRFI